MSLRRVRWCGSEGRPERGERVSLESEDEAMTGWTEATEGDEREVKATERRTGLCKDFGKTARKAAYVVAQRAKRSVVEVGAGEVSRR